MSSCEKFGKDFQLHLRLLMLFVKFPSRLQCLYHPFKSFSWMFYGSETFCILFYFSPHSIRIRQAAKEWETRRDENEIIAGWVLSGTVLLSSRVRLSSDRCCARYSVPERFDSSRATFLRNKKCRNRNSQKSTYTYLNEFMKKIQKLRILKDISEMC